MCPTLGSGDANYHDLRLYKSDPGIPAVQLAEAPASLITACPPGSAPGGGLTLGKRRVIDLALKPLQGVVNAIGRLVMPHPLFGAKIALLQEIDAFGVHLIRASVSPTTLEIGGLDGTATVSVSNGTGEPASGLVVEGHILQGFGETAARRFAGTSLQATEEPFTCASGTCTLPGFHFVANNALGGTGTLVCGSASAEFDLIQGETTLQTITVPITLSQEGGCD